MPTAMPKDPPKGTTVNNGQAQGHKPAGVSVTPEQHVAAVQGFMHQCLRVKYTKAGLPKSKQASKEALSAVVDAAGGADEDSFSVSKRLFKARGDNAHPLIEKVNEWARKVDKWRNSFTFSMAADDTTDSVTLKRAKGERLIRVEDVDSFEDGMEALEQEGLSLARKLHEEWDQVMALEKARLKKEFRDKDYPDKSEIYQVVTREDGEQEELCALRIGRRHYSEVTATVRLPEKVLKTMTQQAAELMNQSIEVAVEDLTRVMVETFSTLAAQLVDRLRVRPRYGSVIYQAVGPEAELLAVKRHAQDPDIPKGSVVILLAYKVEEDNPDTGRKRSRTVKEEFGPLTEEEFEALRVEPMESTRKLTQSVVERFGEYLDTFSNLRSRLGAYGEHMDQALDALKELHHNALKGAKKKSAQAVIEKIKYSDSYRRDLRETLEGTCQTLQAVAEEVKQVRRKVHGNVAKQIAEAQAKRASEQKSLE